MELRTEKRKGELKREKESREETNLLEYLEPKLSAFIKFPLFFCRASSSFTSLSILVIEVGIGSTVGNAGGRGWERIFQNVEFPLFFY